ncbi:uncharacterized protein BYT42DRAFT_583856 [Radiomyces spectabilis]|uniref:uncharacterized protein n=1 Tax=Radiomyces spectabilis TaxID=64574 RepID=UPI00221FD29F|nr:uncharacterized protein BYT42DRAFT_583856 [Radiomyces spectabilis]KAI8369305.1 hypothetical protein BYT42DRAFT_583856 [Radiomyces spectabilis]
MMQTEKPSLPSIQFLLQQHPPDEGTLSVTSEKPALPDTSVPASSTTNTRSSLGHRSSRSISSLPAELQSLSLYAPTPSSKDDSHLFGTSHSASQPIPNHLPFSSWRDTKAPSWMLPADHGPVLPPAHSPTLTTEFPSRPTTTTTTTTTSRRPPGATHGRSISELSMPSHASSHALPILPAPSARTLPTEVPSLQKLKARHLTHRRAVSANTVDFMMGPPPASVVVGHRAQSYSPTEQEEEQAHLHQPTKEVFFEALDQRFDPVQRDAGTGRYVCPYCHKKFSRPSSLRIHTYSHTGEKPFVCTEEGCGRRFSVQSNMRRHLRVHRLGRNVKANPIKEDE